MVEIALPLGRFMVTLPITVSELVASPKLRVPCVVAAVAPRVKEAQMALYPAGMVTVRSAAPSPMTTWSSKTGTDAPGAPPELPDQVEVASQFPFATA